jgi:hypothetical protein
MGAPECSKVTYWQIPKTPFFVSFMHLFGWSGTPAPIFSAAALSHDLAHQPTGLPDTFPSSNLYSLTTKITKKTHYIDEFIIPSRLYMFRAMFSPVISSTWLYLQYLVVFTQVAAGCQPVQLSGAYDQLLTVVVQ